MKAVSSLTSGSIPRTLFTFALPILLGNVLQSVNGSINAVWIGKFLGAAALTGANNSNIVIFLLLGAVFGVTMASTILIAQHVGARRMDEAKKVTGSSATFFFALSLLFSVGGFFAAPSILHWMGTPADAIGYGVDYLRVMFVALPASYAFFFVNGALRGAGDSKTPFRFLLLSVTLDIALNPVFIFGLGPLPALGIAGSALATLVAQSVSLAAILRHVYRERHPLAIHRGEGQLLRIDWQVIRSLVLKGIPMGLQMIVLSSSMVLFLRVVNRFGSDTAAAFAADMQLWTYVQMPALALGAAVSSMAAQNIGAKQWQRVADTAKFGVLFNLMLTGIPVVLIYLTEGLAISVFLPPGSPALDIAVHMNHIILWSYPLFGISMVLSGVVRAAGAVMAPLFILLVALLIVRTPLAEYGFQHWGADGVWWSFSVSAIVAALLSTGYYLSGAWRSASMRVGAPA
ncbi:MAG: MATE family efflux transporter [Gammaproteobacteria bacterium]|nr:MATE family efflux transporter [Gammaproteobacteria bacterium]